MKLIIAALVVYLIYTIQSKLYRKYWNRELNISLSFSGDIARVGDKLFLYEVIENAKSIPLPILNIKFVTSKTLAFSDEEKAAISDNYYRNDYFSLLGNERLKRKLSFTTTKRGFFSIDELRITSKDLFLTKTFADIMPNKTRLTVLPERLSTRPFALIRDQLLGNYPVSRLTPPDPFTFRGIRNYQPYDTFKSINWKASAKMDALMVNEYQATSANEVSIYLNLRPYMKSHKEQLAEHSIRIASTIAADLMEHEVDVSFHTNAYDIEAYEEDTSLPTLSFGHGSEHLQNLDIILARLDIKRKTADMMRLLDDQINDCNTTRSHILISTYRDDALFEFYRTHKETERIYWIIPELPSAEIKLHDDGIIRWDME